MGLFVKRPLFRLAQAGTLLGAVGLGLADPSWGQEKPAAGVVQAHAQRQGISLGAIQPISNEVEAAQIAQTPPPPAPPAPPAADAAPAAEAPAEEEPEEEEPWGLTDIFTDACGNNWMKDCGWKIGGWTAQSVTFNFSSPEDRFNGPVTWTDRSNEYQLNQQWLYIERATDTTDKCFDIGGRIDFMFGTDARFNSATGLENNINDDINHSFYAINLPQFYVEAAYRDVKVKMGHFLSPVGYFAVPTTANFFNSLPYTFQYGEPFNHTGMLATWTVNDKLTVGSGFTRGWDNFDNTNHNLGYLGTITYTFEDKSSLAYVAVFGAEPGSSNADGTSTRYLQTVVYTKPINDCLTYVLHTDYGTQGTTIAPNGGTARWYGLNQYLLMKQNDCLTWGANFEWFRDEDGFRVGGFLPLPGVPNSRGLPTTRSGYAGNFYQITVGPQWTPTQNLLIRPNLRFDWYSGEVLNAGGLLPYDDGTAGTQAILGTDVVLKY